MLPYLKRLMLLVQVILETLRMATVVNGVLRKTTQDVAVKGEAIVRK